MHAHRRSTATALALVAVVFLVIGAASTIDRIPAVDTLACADVVAWLGSRAGATLLAVRCGRLPVPAVGGGSDRRRTGRGLRSVHGALVRERIRHGHRTHDRPHDSGLCAADLATRRRFAIDLLNLTLAGPRVNRYEKVDRDAAEWQPAQNRCWFAARVIAVRQRYSLTIDRREADALEQVLAGCASTELIMFARGEVPATTAPTTRVPEAIAAWDDNRNGRVSCAEARAHGIAPVTHDHPAYPFMRDGDADGVVCESGSRRGTSPPASPRVSGAGCGPYRNCTALRRDYPNGVPRGHCAYQRRMDRDNDGRACER